MQRMGRAVREQEDIARREVSGRAATRVFQHGRTTHHDVIRDLSWPSAILSYEPGCAIKTVEIEMAVNGHHLEKVAEPV